MDELKNMPDGMNLDPETLKKIAGGDADPNKSKFTATYLCPLCNQTHTFIYMLNPNPSGGITANVISSNHCSHTLKVWMKWISSSKVYVIDKNGTEWTSHYTTISVE